MAITAPYSKHKKTNLQIFIAMMLVAAIWFFYDGRNKDFVEKHTIKGQPDSILVFNQKSPPYFLGGAIAFGILLFVLKDRKIVLDDDKIIAPDKTVNIKQIEKIDKTNFKNKGYFVITYKTDSSGSVDWKISDSHYDNLSAMLDEIVKKIS
jgi:hypothetical protein